MSDSLLMLLEMIEEVLEEQNLSEAGLGGKTGLVKYQKRLQEFHKRLQENIAFVTVDGESFTFDATTPETKELINFTNELLKQYNNGKFIIDSKDERYLKLSSLVKKAGLPLTKILKDKELGGEVAGKRLKAEERQMQEIAKAISNAIRENDGKAIIVNVGRRKVEIDGVANVTGTPKADCALTYDNKPVSYISLKSANKPNEMGQWGGITNYLEDPEVAKFIADLYLLQDKKTDPRLETGYYRELKTNLQQYVYGKDWAKNFLSNNNCDLVLATTNAILLEKQTDNSHNFVSTNIFYNPDIPEGDWKPTLYGRFATGRDDVGLNSIRLSVSPLGYRKNRKELPEFDASSKSRALESALEFKLEDIIYTEDIYDKERISYQDADPEEIERIQQQMGRASLEEQIEIEIIDTEET
jgi:hypothetical protein